MKIPPVGANWSLRTKTRTDRQTWRR